MLTSVEPSASCATPVLPKQRGSPLICHRSTRSNPPRPRKPGLCGRYGGPCVRRTAAMLVAMWVGGSSTAHATSLDRPWTSLAYPPAFEHVSVEQGLSQSSVHTIAQDKLGFLWMGTDAGLNRYDGFHFQTFHPDGSGRSLAGDWIERIVPDRHGYLWIAARNAGLTLLDPETLATVAIPISTQPGGLPARTVNAMVEDRDGTLWIGTEADGLFRVNGGWVPPAEPRFERIAFSKDGKSAPKRVSALFLDHHGGLW